MRIRQSKLQRELARNEVQRRDYTAFSSFCGTHQLAARRGSWTCASQRVTAGAAYVADDNGTFDLENINGAQHAHAGLIPYVDLTGTEYLRHIDDPQFDILATETTVIASQRGLTATGWYLAGSVAGVPFLQNKFLGAGNQRAWAVFINGGLPSFQISSTGAAVTDSVAHTTAMVINTWYFVAARFWPANNTITIMLDNDIVTVAAVSAAIFNSSADFRIGADGGGTSLFTGRLSNQTLCAAALDNNVLQSMFQNRRAQYGK